MIPKTIHYCWLSNDPKPKNVRECIRSWKRKLPDYTLKCWDVNSFDFDSVPFAREALAARKWAFVADFIRLYALYTEGGIYLDSDVQVFSGLDGWLGYDLFTGIEKRGDTDELFIEAAIIGAAKGNAVIKECLDLYSGRSFVLDDGSFNQTPVPTLITPIFKSALGWEARDRTQHLPGGSVVFASDTIANTESPLSDTVVLYHWNNRSWIDRTPKEKIYKMFKDLGLIKVKKGHNL